MSPRRSIKPLSYLALHQVSNQLIQVVGTSHELSTVDPLLLQGFTDQITHRVAQLLLNSILSNEYLDAATRFACLRLLLRADTSILETGMFPGVYYEDILKLISEQGTGLRHLDLKGVWARDHTDLVAHLVSKLSEIRVLVIPHIADDSVLDSLVNCVNLQVLDISGECTFSVAALERVRSDTISVLNIGTFGKVDICQQEASGIEIAAKIIGNLPNLTALRTYSFTGNALLHLMHTYSYSSTSNSLSNTTKLRYLHDIGTTLEISDAIVGLCPDLECVHIESPVCGALSKLCALKKLHTLKLVKADNVELLELLRTIGANLHTLNLSHNKTQPLDLAEICLLCPNLHILECFQMNLKLSTSDNCCFMCLESVEFLYTALSGVCLMNLLLSAPLLKRVIIGCILNITDGDVFRLCAETDFLFLEEFWLSCAKGLTATCVELLMGHCPNLKVIGQMTGWDIHQEEVEYLRAVILYTNTELTLLPLGSL